MKYQKHKDLRGIFQELHRSGDADFYWKQLSICSIEPGQTRGSHYHMETWEKYIVIEGKMKVQTRHMKQENSNYSVELSNDEEDRLNNEIILMPWVHHTVSSEQGCKFLILSSKMFNPDSPDTFYS